MGSGAGFGKTILIGDMFVYLGVPAIVSAIPQGTTAIVERAARLGWTLQDNRAESPGYKNSKQEQQKRSINILLDETGIDTRCTGVDIVLGGDLVVGSGIGASAASCVAIARALNEEFGLQLSDEEINQLAWLGEHAYHGHPSGIDNTASCFGGVMTYHVPVNATRPTITRIDLQRPIEAVLVNSGVNFDTSTKRAYISQYAAANPSVYSQQMDMIQRQCMHMADALRQGDLRQVGKLMNENHAILIDMGLSHEVIIRLSDIGIKEGAWGCKITGGGRGGYMLSLTPGTELQEHVAGVFEKKGFISLRVSIGAV
jgi:mevalonate kinase